MSKPSEDYQRHLLLQAQSGLSKAGYCKQAGIPYQSFLYHWKKQNALSVSNGFTLLKPGKSKSKGVELHLPNGCYFLIPEDCPMNLLQKLMSLC